MKKFLYFILLINSCYLLETKEERQFYNHYLDIDIQIDPILKIEDKDLIYVDESSLPDEIENRNLFHHFKNSLKENGYKLTQQEKQANVVVKAKRFPRVVNYKETKRVIAEETKITKKTYIKEKDKFEEEPKTTTKYKEVPYEYTKTHSNIEFNFYKIKDKKSINIIKASMEESVVGTFKDFLKQFIDKLVEKVSLNIEIRERRISWN